MSMMTLSTHQRMNRWSAVVVEPAEFALNLFVLANHPVK